MKFQPDDIVKSSLKSDQRIPYFKIIYYDTFQQCYRVEDNIGRRSWKTTRYLEGFEAEQDEEAI